MPVAVITRATLRLSKLISFWKYVPAASKAIEAAKGVKYFKGIGEWPFIQQATLSLWDGFDSVKNFAYSSKIHSDIIKKTRKQKWYSEDLLPDFKSYLILDSLIQKRFMRKAVVIGAGIAGIASAIRLVKKGYMVDVFESNSYPGGKLSSFRIGDYRFDAGLQLFTMPNYVDELFELFDEKPSDFFTYKKKRIACKYFWDDGVELSAYSDKILF